MVFPQGCQWVCLPYCLANALYYTGLRREAGRLTSEGYKYAHSYRHVALHALQMWMSTNVKSMGRAETFPREKKPLSVAQLLAWRDTFPKVALLADAEGESNHAICLIDDLIFDSSCHNAVAANAESLEYLFERPPTSVICVLYFNQHVGDGKPKERKRQRTGPRDDRPLNRLQRPIQLHQFNQSREIRYHWPAR